LRVLVFGDTHGDIDLAFKIIKKERADMVLHAGDFLRDAHALANEAQFPVHGVTGNCDLPGSGPHEKFLSLEGKDFLLTHGHQFRVKASYQSIFYKASENKIDAVVFGHTHVPLNDHHQGILLFNPGSISRPQPGSQPSYGIITIKDNDINGEIYFVDGQKRNVKNL